MEGRYESKFRKTLLSDPYLFINQQRVSKTYGCFSFISTFWDPQNTNLDESARDVTLTCDLSHFKHSRGLKIAFPNCDFRHRYRLPAQLDLFLFPLQYHARDVAGVGRVVREFFVSRTRLQIMPGTEFGSGSDTAGVGPGSGFAKVATHLAPICSFSLCPLFPRKVANKLASMLFTSSLIVTDTAVMYSRDNMQKVT